MPVTHARNLELEDAALPRSEDDEDDLRVYADWLLAQGDPRGELVSLELHRRRAFRSERLALERELATREAPYRERFGAWASERGVSPAQVALRQGFVVSLELPCAQLATCCAELFEREPLQRLTLTGVDGGLAELLRTHGAYFERLHYLKLSGSLDLDGAEALAACAFPRLEGLNLLGTGIELEHGTILAQLNTRRLRSLTLTANEIDDEALEPWLAAPMRTQWRALYLSQNPIGAAGVSRIVDAAGLEQLEGLYLRAIEADFAALTKLAEAEGLPALRTLEIDGPRWRERQLAEPMQARFANLKLT